VDWDPDADKLVVWAQTLGWDDDYLLKRLGRVVVPGAGTMTPELRQAIKDAVGEGVREGVAEALLALGPLVDDSGSGSDGPTGPDPTSPAPHRALLA